MGSLCGCRGGNRPLVITLTSDTMARVYRLDHVRALCRRAILSGGEVLSVGHVRWPICGNCAKPYQVDMVGRGDRGFFWQEPPRPFGVDTREYHYDPIAGFFDENGISGWVPLKRLYQSKFAKPGWAWLEILTRCRKCQECLQHRARLWRARARSEIEEAPRTWFVTYTFNEVHRYQARLKARQLLVQRDERQFEQLTPDEQFMLLHEVLSRELTLMIKRLRKNTKAILRYAMVAEAHQDGFPHYHGLIHELVPGTVRERDLRDEWRGHGLGFCEAKLVEDAGRGAAYVCKYLTKSSLARVRASQNYGKGFAKAEVERTSGTNVKVNDKSPPNNKSKQDRVVVSSIRERSPGEGTDLGAIPMGLDGRGQKFSREYG